MKIKVKALETFRAHLTIANGGRLSMTTHTKHTNMAREWTLMRVAMATTIVILVRMATTKLGYLMTRVIMMI